MISATRIIGVKTLEMVGVFRATIKPAQQVMSQATRNDFSALRVAGEAVFLSSPHVRLSVVRGSDNATSLQKPRMGFVESRLLFSAVRGSWLAR